MYRRVLVMYVYIVMYMYLQRSLSQVTSKVSCGTAASKISPESSLFVVNSISFMQVLDKLMFGMNLAHQH